MCNNVLILILWILVFFVLYRLNLILYCFMRIEVIEIFQESFLHVITEWFIIDYCRYSFNEAFLKILTNICFRGEMKTYFLIFCVSRSHLEVNVGVPIVYFFSNIHGVYPMVILHTLTVIVCACVSRD